MPTSTATTPITDREIATMLLTSAKDCAKKSCAAAIEAASPDLHRLFVEETDNALRFQRKVWEYMHKKGWYDPYQTPRQMAEQDLRTAAEAVR
jgi:similar to spore coat protein